MTRVSIPDLEKEILQFWQDNNIFQKSLDKPSPNGEFVFYDGPPFATGLPHYGHLVGSMMKDMVPRFWTMRGYHVERKWGWDCHGLPIENIVEKELGLEHKRDIVEYGVGKFNAECHSKIMLYAEEWQKVISRFGRWADMDDDYKTMDGDFMETEWWVFKQLWEKGLLYKDYKSMHICPRCETTLAQAEVSEGYKDVEDVSVIAKFRIKNQEVRIKGHTIDADKVPVYMLAWTTTPWTLPGNVALAVNRDLNYSVVEVVENLIRGGDKDSFVLRTGEGEDGTRKVIRVIVAEDSLDRLKSEIKTSGREMVLNLDASIGVFKGKDLIGLSYEPLFPYYEDAEIENKKNAWKIYQGDFVTTDEGTGIVHIVPAFGEDDMQLGRDNELPFLQHVNMDGTFKSEVIDFAGQEVKPRDAVQRTDEKIITYLKNKNLVFASETYKHTYPHCWRCDTPLLNYATDSWFVAVTQVKDKLLANAKHISWVPEYVKEGRFGNWLEGARDWSISRERFWGTPLPVWHCTAQDCGHKEIIGSREELYEKASNKPTRIFLVRHGESEKNVAEIMSSRDQEYPLTKKGKNQAKAKAELLQDKHIDVILSSPVLRAQQTAEHISKECGVEIVTEEKLREQANGEWEGKTKKEVSKDPERIKYLELWQAKDRAVFDMPRGKTGQSFRDFQKLQTEVLSDIVTKYQGKTVAIVAHQANMLTMIESLRDYSMTQMRDLCFSKEMGVAAMPIEVYLDINSKEFNLHRPHIDEITLRCGKCESEMEIEGTVLDCWFESGSMPYAQQHYPFQNKETFEHNFPAQFIAEGADQVSKWFYYMHVLATILRDSPAFENVVVNGIVLAEDGKKMSKRLQNYPEVNYILDTYGADALRYYIATSPVVRFEDLRFSEKEVEEVVKKVLLIVQNVVSFYQMFAGDATPEARTDSRHVLDQWIVAKLQELHNNTTAAYDTYDLNKASRPLGEFITELSTWYIRRSRARFKGDDEQDKQAALSTLRFVLLELAKHMAPVMPFIADRVYKAVQGEKESVHLEDWGEVYALSKEQHKVLAGMSETRTIVEKALALRAEAGIKVRQPLSELKVKESILADGLVDILKEEVNVKAVTLGQAELQLATELTDELRQEGLLRELVRHINVVRKKAGLSINDMVTLALISDNEAVAAVVNTYKDELQKSTLASDVVVTALFDTIATEKVAVNGVQVVVQLQKH